jgi:transposase
MSRQEKELLCAEGRERLRGLDLPGAARKVVEVCLKMIEHINEEISPIEAELQAYARAQSGCRALVDTQLEMHVAVALDELGREAWES